MDKSALTSSFNVNACNREMALLYPGFADAVGRALRNLKAKAGIDAALFEGWRSPLRQDWLFSSGRTREGRILTKARRWESWHQYGLAGDIVLDNDPGPRTAWYWDKNLSTYELVAKIFKEEGLHWLGLGDAGHFELNGGLTVGEAQSITRDHGLQQLWLEIQRRTKL